MSAAELQGEIIKIEERIHWNFHAINPAFSADYKNRAHKKSFEAIS